MSSVRLVDFRRLKNYEATREYCCRHRAATLILAAAAPALAGLRNDRKPPGTRAVNAARPQVMIIFRLGSAGGGSMGGAGACQNDSLPVAVSGDCW